MAICCFRRGVNSTPHTSLFLMQWTRTHCCTSHCMAQEFVGARHLIYMVIHVVRLSVVCSLTLCSSPCSFPCVSPVLSSTWTLSWTSSSMWTSSGQYPTGNPPTEESGPLAENAPLTGYEPKTSLAMSTTQRLLKSSSRGNPATRCLVLVRHGTRRRDHRQSALFTTLHAGARRTRGL